MRIRVHYPATAGQLVVRSDADWDRDVGPRRVARDGSWHEFRLDGDRPFRYFKPVLRTDDHARWAQGANCLALPRSGTRLDVYPHFDPDLSCHECTRHRIPSRLEERGVEVRVFLPPGYDENPLATFPVLYMQDGHNLFFPADAHNGRHWRVPETLRLLDSMNLIRRVIVVGVYPQDRLEQYTAPGYDRYGQLLVSELKPWVDGHYRAKTSAGETAVLGSSLGGVVALHLGLRYPEVFGLVGAMSSTFGYRDDLMKRVLDEPPRPIRIYLDSGWPEDNYEVTRAMHAALLSRGLRDGSDIQYLAFPRGRHDEDSWAARVHLPFQFFFRS